MSETDGAGRGADLFEQWLAHHEGRPADAAQEPDHNLAGASVLAALHADKPAPEPVEPAPVVEDPVTEVDVRGHQVPAQPSPTRLADPVHSLPQTIFFKPRGGTQRILGLLLLVFLALTAGAAWWAYQDRSYTSYAIVGVIAVVTGVIWATRASATPARLTLHGSELEIVRNGSKTLFDLAHVQVEVHGAPGGRGWKVLILRRSMSPYVIDSSMVDPREFTYVVRFFHPEV